MAGLRLLTSWYTVDAQGYKLAKVSRESYSSKALMINFLFGNFRINLIHRVSVRSKLDGRKAISFAAVIGNFLGRSRMSRFSQRVPGERLSD